MKKFFKETASGSVVLVFGLILLAHCTVFPAKNNSEDCFFDWRGIADGPKKAFSAATPTNPLDCPAKNNSAEENFAGFVLLENSSMADPMNPLNNVRLTQDGLMLYQIQPGDALAGIAAKFGITAKTILWANNGLNSSRLKPGLEIVILPVEGILHDIKEGETLDSVATVYDIDIEEIKKFNPKFQEILSTNGGRLLIPHRQPLKNAPYDSSAYILPNLGNYFKMPVSGWNWGRLHEYNAVDIANRCGTTVVSAAEGLIVEAAENGWNQGYGNYLKIEHPNKTHTLYSHLNKIMVEQNEYVLAGTPIGLMGNTGNAHGPTGCHLHFEIYGAKNTFAKY